jgi:predicted dehydrogenase
MTQTLRWGVLSTAKIGRTKIIPAMAKAKNTQCLAIGSRNLAQAQAVAAELGISKAYGSYEDLLADPEIDAIYNPLPNDLHVPWSIAALQAGKHVLCEKPIGLNHADAHQLWLASQAHPHLQVMEAFMYRFHPQWQCVKRWLQEGAIGEPRSVQAYFSYNNHEPDNIRNNPAAGGGALMDIGCYAISVARWVFDRPPLRVLGLQDQDPRFHVDRLFTGQLAFAQGAAATFMCSTKTELGQRVYISGTQGSIEIMHPFFPADDTPQRLHLVRNGQLKTEEFIGYDHYQYLLEAFAAGLQQPPSGPAPLVDALENMQVIDALFNSCKTGAWVDLLPQVQ